ncbi:RNA-directed DNA polymerase, eukaryota, reverse transcriptase zinc-binding domain protein [Tanacetum coccineum]
MYLGLPVGKDMRKSVNWNGVIDRFSKKLSTWKANMLSIGGRLTLVKSVLENLPIYFLSLFRAPASVIKKMKSIRMRFFWEVLVSLTKKYESLLRKWKMERFLSEPHALWNKCIKTINGYNGGFDSGLGSGSCPGVWDNIIRCCNEMMEKFHINLDNLMMKKVNSGNQTQFWTDSWISGMGPLNNCFPRLYTLETNKLCLVSETRVMIDYSWTNQWSWRREPRGRTAGDLYTLENLINGLSLNASVADKWIWSPDAAGLFTVKSLSNLIQNRLIGGGRIDVPFKWNSWVPREVNIYAWRLAMNRLPTKDKLTRFGIQISSTSCVFCGVDDETRDHCFLQCSKIKFFWFKLWSW